MLYQQPNNQFQQMVDYIRFKWDDLMRRNANRLTNGLDIALMNHLNQMLSSWANTLCQMINQGSASQVIDQTIYSWFISTYQSYVQSSGFIPQNMGYAQPNAFGPSYGSMPMGGPIGYGGMPMAPAQPFGGKSILEMSNEMYSNTSSTPKKVDMPEPIAPMGNLPQQTETTPVTKQIESFKAPEEVPVTKSSYKVPVLVNHKEVTFKLPVAGKGYIDTYKINQGTKTSQKLFIELDKFTDNVRGILDKLKKKYDVDQIVIKYRSFELVKCNLADLQKVFLKIKDLRKNEAEDFEETNKKIIEVLDSKPKNITKQVESIVLKEYNGIIKHFEPPTMIVDSLDALLTNDKNDASYVNASLSLINATMIYDPASTEMSPYLQDYEVEEDKTYKDLRKNKDKFIEWAKDHAVVVSHPKILRYTKIFDVEPNIFCQIATGNFEIGYEDDGSPLSCDFEYFLNDEIELESSLETMIVQNNGSSYEIHIGRKNILNEKTGAITKQASLRND